MTEYRSKLTNIGDYKERRDGSAQPEQTEPGALTPEDTEFLGAMKKNLLGFAAMIHDGYPYFYRQRRKWIDADLDGNPNKDEVRSAIDSEWDKKLKILKAYVPVMLDHLTTTIDRYGSVSGEAEPFLALAQRYLPVVSKLKRDLDQSKEKFDVEMIMQKADSELAELLNHTQAS